jgi:hypothetical protein
MGEQHLKEKDAREMDNSALALPFGCGSLIFRGIFGENDYFSLFHFTRIEVYELRIVMKAIPKREKNIDECSECILHDSPDC